MIASICLAQDAHRAAEGSNFIVQHRNLPELSSQQRKRKRSSGSFTNSGRVYSLEMTTLGWPRPSCELSEAEMKLAVHAILHALVSLHGQGLVHRDLRFDNVLWRPYGGGPFLTDLELAAKKDQKVREQFEQSTVKAWDCTCLVHLILMPLDRFRPV